MKTVTAREFQRTFQRLTEPTLVGKGIWFPEVDAALLALAEGTEPPNGAATRAIELHGVAPVKAVTPGHPGRVVDVKPTPRPDFSKSAQAKGHMGR